MPHSEQYTEECTKAAAEIVAQIRALADTMAANGDEARAMDLTEAITYVEAAVAEY